MYNQQLLLRCTAAHRLLGPSYPSSSDAASSSAASATTVDDDHIFASSANAGSPRHCKPASRHAATFAPFAPAESDPTLLKSPAATLQVATGRGHISRRSWATPPTSPNTPDAPGDSGGGRGGRGRGGGKLLLLLEGSESTSAASSPTGDLSRAPIHSADLSVESEIHLQQTVPFGLHVPDSWEEEEEEEERGEHVNDATAIVLKF